MAETTHIEWTDATWNPVTGCSVVSPGCTNCYAMRLAGTRLQHHESRAGLTTPSKAGPVWNGQVRLNQGWLTQPLAWKRPRRIFVCAHGDLFHESVPDAWIDQVFAVMALAPQHAFQVLTKRSARMREYLTSQPQPDRFVTIREDGSRHPTPASFWRAHASMCDLLPMVATRHLNWLAELAEGEGRAGFMRAWPLPNVWLGVSAEDQTRADERLPDLLGTPAAIRFLSAEPLLGPVKIPSVFLRPSGEASLHWIIAGGESGPGARPMHPDWPRQLRDQCAAAGVPFFFKQWGEWSEVDDGRGPDTHRIIEVPEDYDDEARTLIDACEHPAWVSIDGRLYPSLAALPIDVPCRLIERLGKRAAGRLLDGVAHDAMPAAAPLERADG